MGIRVLAVKSVVRNEPHAWPLERRGVGVGAGVCVQSPAHTAKGIVAERNRKASEAFDLTKAMSFAN